MAQTVNSAPQDFAAFILTNGRPDRVYTYDSLRRAGYTGPIYIIIDDLDKTAPDYIARYRAQVKIFDKCAIAKEFDTGDNFNDMRAIAYARNAIFKIAKNLGLKYFIQLDDDYTAFAFRFNRTYDYDYGKVTRLDNIFKSLLEFYELSGAASLAISQGGDFVGGPDGSNANLKKITLLRKCMNSFICSTDRPFSFIGRVNEDVNTYTRLASTGMLFLTTNQVSLGQRQTQTNSGGMTELYLDSGTYIKSFYSVMYQPSSVKVSLLNGQRNVRLHHSVNWRKTVPKIIRETLRKS